MYITCDISSFVLETWFICDFNDLEKKTVCLQGMVSSMAFNPAFQDIYAVGTYSQSSKELQ